MSAIRYHWIITIKRDAKLHPAGGTMRTREGTVQPLPGETRQQLYYRICDELQEPGPYGVLFFALEPDEMLAGMPDDVASDSRNGS